MMQLKVFGITLLAALVNCEPPVGYNYRAPNNYQPSNGYNAPRSSYNAPSSGYNAPSNNYLPPSTGFTAPSNNYLPPSSFSSGSGYAGAGRGSYDDHGHGHENEVPKSYEFGYSVKDAQSGNDYDRKEVSDGNVVRGEYRVQLPDGRTQIVTYHADWQTGFHADVRYEGEARYPEPSHSNNQGGYNYNAPADFSGSLTGFNAPKQPSTSYGPPGYH